MSTQRGTTLAVLITLLIGTGLLSGCRSKPGELPPAPPQPDVTATVLAPSSPTVVPSSAFRPTASAVAEPDDGWPARNDAELPLVAAELPPGWRMIEPRPADMLLANQQLAPAHAQLASALGKTPVRLILPAEAPSPDAPHALLFAVPRVELPLTSYIALVAETLAEAQEMVQVQESVDYELAAGKGPVGLLQYQQLGPNGAPRFGLLAAIPHAPTDTFLLLVATAGPQAEDDLADLLAAVAPTITVVDDAH